METLKPDQKGEASLEFADVVRATRDNFPDPRFRPITYHESPYYTLAGFSVPPPFMVWSNSDGIGTKPELAERLSEYQPFNKFNPQFFESLAYDAFAMIEGGAYRFGHFLLGVTDVLDTNKANPEMISALARGAKKACDDGRFCLINGEIAELGSKTGGYGKNRVNWGGSSIYLINPEKVITGQRIEPGQYLVGLQENSFRSNGLTLVRKILEADYLTVQGASNRTEYFLDKLGNFLEDEGFSNREWLDTGSAVDFFENLTPNGFIEETPIPWHQYRPELVEKILEPSTLYGKLIYEAQGGVDKQKIVDITGIAHITGGGIPEKVKRMVEINSLGADIKAVFPDPEAQTEILEIGQHMPYERLKLAQPLTDKKACENWNRGIGYVVATKSIEDAERLIELSDSLNYKAAIVGKITDERTIKFRGHTWNY